MSCTAIILYYTDTYVHYMHMSHYYYYYYLNIFMHGDLSDSCFLKGRALVNLHAIKP